MPLIDAAELGHSVSELFQRRQPLPRAAEPEDGYPPPGSHEGGLALEEVLAERRSVRDFGAAPVALTDLLSLLRLAESAQRKQWPAEVHGDPGLAVLVAAEHVEDLDAAIYHRDGALSLRRLEAPPWQDELVDTCPGAAAVALICGSVRQVGAPAYGGLLVRAGALGYAIWLAARTHGLECSVFGGARPAVSRLADGVRPGLRHLFTVAIGHAADE
ncbi:nitroreductase family protein [Saccharomonospora piscinae]|uniref:nitroreductase family protein n=1 Tax=Saccharomonospora piscinae TaxID=687388 RepID=UPI0004665A9B|nr:nitroreductase family protein [Saccharomonospora piscinae]